MEEFLLPEEVCNRGRFKVKSCWWVDQVSQCTQGQQKALCLSPCRATIFDLLQCMKLKVHDVVVCLDSSIFRLRLMLGA